MGKKDVDASMEEDEDESVVVLSPIAQPLAKDKLVKKILKLVKAGVQSACSLCFFRTRAAHAIRPVAALSLGVHRVCCRRALTVFTVFCSFKGQDRAERSEGGGQSRAQRRKGHLRDRGGHLAH